jgi:hypothetical protein
MTDALAQAARRELESREKNYPKSVASGKLTADEATIDFQAWHCICAWLETGQFRAIDAGGVDGLTVVGWALAEAAADKAVITTGDALKVAEAEGDEAKAQRLTQRGAALRLIARKVARQHALIASINLALRERQRQQAKAA